MWKESHRRFIGDSPITEQRGVLSSRPHWESSSLTVDKSAVIDQVFSQVCSHRLQTCVPSVSSAVIVKSAVIDHSQSRLLESTPRTLRIVYDCRPRETPLWLQTCVPSVACIWLHTRSLHIYTYTHTHHNIIIWIYTHKLIYVHIYTCICIHESAHKHTHSHTAAWAVYVQAALAHTYQTPRIQLRLADVFVCG